MTAKQAGARAARWKTLWVWVTAGLVGLSCFGVEAGFSYRLIDRAIERAEVTGCQARLRDTYKERIMYKIQYGGHPQGSGLSSFAPLVARMTPENSRASVETYAGRNQRDFPLDAWPSDGEEPLAACANHGSMNHRDATNVLYADGSIRTYSLNQLKAEGVLPPEATVLLVGPGSPIHDLRKLTLD